MRRLLLLHIWALCLNAFPLLAQPPFDTARSTDQRSSPIEKEGVRRLMLPDHMVVVVENDLRTITLYQNDKLKWQTDLLKAVDPTNQRHWIGEPVIRYITLESTYLNVTFAKHCWAHVQLDDGAAKLQGCD